jgi:hypothetical protein
MKDEKEVSRHKNGIDAEFDEEGPQGLGGVGFHAQKRPGITHTSLVATPLAAPNRFRSRFPLRRVGFFLPSISLLAGELWQMLQINIRKT